MSVKTLFQTESVATGSVPLKFTLLHQTRRKRRSPSRERQCYTALALQFNASSTLSPVNTKPLKEWRPPWMDLFAPKSNVVEERYKFRSRARKADEYIDAYLTIFRELAKSCDFGDLEKEMIRDQIVEKCSSHILKQRLLQQGDLFLAKTVKIARNAETTVQEARLLS